MATRKAPNGLDIGGKRLWRAVVDQFELAQHESDLLLQACRCRDRLDRLEAAAVGAPLVVDGKANPLLVEARQQSIVLARLLAALRLPDDPDQVRAPYRTGARGVYTVGGGNAPGNRAKQSRYSHLRTVADPPARPSRYDHLKRGPA